jgi:hypothetical protein
MLHASASFLFFFEMLHACISLSASWFSQARSLSELVICLPFPLFDAMFALGNRALACLFLWLRVLYE